MNDTLVRFECSACHNSLKGSPTLYGKRVKCPKCRHPFVLKPEHEVVDATLVDEVVTHAGGMPYIPPSHLRVDGESLVLYFTLFIAVGLFLLLSLSTAFIFLIAVAFVYFDVVGHESNLPKTAERICKTGNPRLDLLIQTASRRLTIPTPNLFVVKNREVNAYATGFHAPGTVVLNSGLLEIMNDDELMFIIGHELTHLKCGHCKYLVFTNATIGSAVNQFTAAIVDLIFNVWSRKAEYTCDRGGLVACKNPKFAMTALAKLESLDDNEILDRINNAIRGSEELNDVFSTHPETGNRISAIWDYSQTEEFGYMKSIWH